MIPGLLVGSNARWRDQIEGILLAHGIRIEWWWPTVANLGSIPARCRVVIVATDNCSHKLSKPVLQRAREAGIPLVCGSHRKSAMAPLLDRAGFPLLTTFATEAPIACVDPTLAALATLPASVILDLPMLADDPPIPEPEAPTPPEEETAPMPIFTPAPVAHGARHAKLRGNDLRHYDTMLPLLAATPHLHSPAVAAKLGVKVTALYGALAAARETLGISASASAAYIADRPRYEAACAALGVDPVMPPPPLTLPKISTLPTPAPVVTLPVTTPPPAPAPVAALLPGEAATDTLAGIRLLLDAMRSEGVEHVAVNDDGTVTIRRRIVVTSTLSI